MCGEKERAVSKPCPSLSVGFWWCVATGTQRLPGPNPFITPSPSMSHEDTMFSYIWMLLSPKDALIPFLDICVNKSMKNRWLYSQSFAEDENRINIEPHDTVCVLHTLLCFCVPNDFRAVIILVFGDYESRISLENINTFKNVFLCHMRANITQNTQFELNIKFLMKDVHRFADQWTQATTNEKES